MASSFKQSTFNTIVEIEGKLYIKHSVQQYCKFCGTTHSEDTYIPLNEEQTARVKGLAIEVI